MLQQPNDAQQRLALLSHGIRPLAHIAGRTGAGPVRRSGQDRLFARRRYAYDPDRDACTCSLHNRLKYLTPNIELNVLSVSQNEAAEYDRYKQRYQAFWQGMFDPIAVRITVDRRVKLEMCVLPMANGSFYNDLRAVVAKTPRPLGTARIAPSALASLAIVPGRKAIGDLLRGVPGVAEVLCSNPTLADLAWVGDRAGSIFATGTRSCRSIRPCCVRCNCPCWATCRSGSKARPRPC